jgi:methylmalonyl-CoA mutase N-terminal domain/subunit
VIERYGSKNPRTGLRFHTQTADVRSRRSPYNNVWSDRAASPLRGSRRHAILACIHWTKPGLSPPICATIALRTQQIIAHETGVTNTVDPLGGSYFVEALTNEVEAAHGTTSAKSVIPWAAW